MKFVGMVFSGVFYLAFLIEKICSVVLQPEMTLVDLTHSKIITSPLKSGSNSLELLVPDFSKPPICVVTLPLIPSWLLIDLGFMVSGLSQIRLVSDSYIENSHELLTDIEVELAEYLSPSDYQNSNSFENSQLTRCGKTGTVTQYTSNVVVDCASPSKVRWVLLKKQGQLHLCYVQILQNTVRPECFQSLSQADPLYRKAKRNLSVFRSNKHKKHLECLQNCDTESQCEAIAFIPYGQGIGLCQLLRVKNSIADSLCDDSCQLSINRCHLGERVRIIKAGHGDILKLPAMAKGSFALSIEINGTETCETDNCGRTSLYLSDSHGVVHHCGTIDRHQYRILFNAIFICDKPVRAPREMIFRTHSKNQVSAYTFTKIHIRFAKEGSFAHSLMNVFTSTSLSKLYSISTVTPRTSMTSLSSTVSSPPLSMTSSAVKVVSSTPLTVSTEIYSTTAVPSTKREWYPYSKPGNQEQYSDPRRSINNDEGITNPIKPQINEITRKYQRLESSTLVRGSTKNILKNKSSSRRPQTNLQRVSQSSEIKLSSLVPISNITAYIFKPMNFERNDFPFLWIIFLLFGAILVLVTVIVVVITFIDGKRKRKKWDIPLGGLCPKENGSGSTTVQTSLHVSTTR